MNNPTTDFLTAAEKALITSDVVFFNQDDEVGRDIEYKDFQSRTRTPSTGAMAPVYSDYDIRATRISLTAREIVAGNGLFQQGDVRYMLAQAQIPGVTPHREDRIVDGSDTYEVVDWSADPISATWNVVARRVK